jgi:glycosyltransferase involved in cell wall biosynthesis
MIVRDNAEFIESCLDSVIDYCDEVIITDTGSVDNTQAVLKRYLDRKSIPHQIVEYTPKTHPESFLLDDEALGMRLSVPAPYSNEWILADFGGARQFGWQKATCDYLMWLDSDDLVRKAQKIPEITSTLKAENLSAAMIDYEYAADEKGNVVCKLRRERIIKKGVGTWRHPIHEVVGVSGPFRLFEGLEIAHRRNEIRKTNKVKIEFRNLKVLLSRYEKEKNNAYIDPRLLFYLGMELRGLSSDRAEPVIIEYTKRSDWDEERSVAFQWLGEIAESRGNYYQAFLYYAAASIEFPVRPEGLFGCARTFYFRALQKVKDKLPAVIDWQKCVELTERGYESTRFLWPKTPLLQNNPTERIYRPLTFVSKAYIDSGKVKEGMEAAQRALEINPGNPEMRRNVEICQNWFAGIEKTKEANRKPVQEGVSKPSHPEPITGETQNPLMLSTQVDGPRAADFLLKSPPGSSGPANASPKNVISNVAVPFLPLDIVIWTGPAFETWSPLSLEQTGIGGSETAAVMMAKNFAKQGHRVRVLNDCKHFRGMYDGVEYIHFDEARKKPGRFDCDIFVASRQIWALDLPIEARAKLLWAHDIHVGPYDAAFERRILRADRILCLSKWHKKNLQKTYPSIPEETFFLTRNGIDKNRFADEPKKIGNRLIYSSSANRGLDVLLDLFPRIREKIGDAELHVYYGFDVWEAMIRQSGNLSGPAPVGPAPVGSAPVGSAPVGSAPVGFAPLGFGVIESLKRKMVETAGVVYHGRVPQRELAEAFLASKVWAYPTAFTETSCITAIEAQAAGCVPVTTHVGALSETVKEGILDAGPNSNELYQREFVKNVVELLRDESVRAPLAIKCRNAILRARHDWSDIAQEWNELFSMLLAKKAENILPPYFIEMVEAPRTILR